MAEFVEVMKKKKEMCEHYGVCVRCPLYEISNNFEIGCGPFTRCYPQEAEKIIMDWEKPVDWSKVEVDTPILVRREETSDWVKRHFARSENNKVFAWIEGRTSFTAEVCEISEWEYAKLAKDGE